jgi:hypothetical protein
MADTYLDLTLNSHDIKLKVIDNGDGTYSLDTVSNLEVGDLNIGNVDVASIAAGDNNIGNVDIDNLYIPDTFKDQATVAIGSIATVWTPATGKKVRLMGGYISVSAAVSILFEDNAAGTTVFRTPKLLADTPFVFDLGNGILLSHANDVLKATSSAAANLTGTLYGREE